MPPPIYFRIVGHVVTLIMHSINSAVMLSSLLDEVIMRDPEVKDMVSMQSRFLTVWNIGFQLSYFSLALISDALTLTHRDHLLPNSIKKFRNFFFSSTVFPATMLVFTLFWPFYIYDRSIIFPKFIDKVFSQKSNYVMHMGIAPVVMWELAFQPRARPRSHKPYVAILCAINVSYNTFLLYTYQQRGLWPYPLMGYVYGTIYNVVLHVYIILLMLFVYYIQWPLSDWIWRNENKAAKIKHK